MLQQLRDRQEKIYNEIETVVQSEAPIDLKIETVDSLLKTAEEIKDKIASISKFINF